jgi:hypothetical protein
VDTSGGKGFLRRSSPQVSPPQFGIRGSFARVALKELRAMPTTTENSTPSLEENSRA